ncbi:MAG: NAD(P)/FAD-dependent oxidoreductase [Acidimicrobiales bacterium]
MNFLNQTRDYDAIVVGARAAGSATALLMARQGLDVLVVDRAPYGSETTSTHALLGPGVMLLQQWGVLDAVVAAGTPAIEATTMNYYDETSATKEAVSFDLTGRPLYAPRRTVIDPLLADMASLAGADVRFETPVRDLIRGHDGSVEGAVVSTSSGESEVRAPLVVGADGLRSFVARQVDAPITYRGKSATACITAYFDGVDLPGAYNWYHGVEGAAGSIPTNDGLYSVFAAVSDRRFRTQLRDDTTGAFGSVIDQVAPELAEHMKDASQATRFRSFPGERSFTRTAAGPGWALVGDAGAFIDPMTAHGMSAAFRDAQACADAAVCTLDSSDTDNAWGHYEHKRDEVSRPMIDAVDDVAAFRHPLDRVQQAHIKLSKIVGGEAAEILGAQDTFDPCSRAAA